MAEQEEDFSSLPLPDRFQHKIWKVRKQGYEDAAKAFEATPDEHHPAFRPFLQDPGLMTGAAADSNVAAQQEGIAALCAFLKFGGRENCTRTRSHALTPLYEKGLASTRAATKASALEAILLYIELDVAAPVVEGLLPALANKQPKIIAAALAALTQIVHNYGCKIVDPKSILKALPKPFGHADKNVRAEAMNLTVELYRWLREAIKPMLWDDLKNTQQADLETQFERIKSEPVPKQERLLRSQQEAAARAPAAGAAEEEEDELEAEGVEIDAFDIAEPQEVLSKVEANFSDQLASSKWKERKEALEALFIVLNVPRLKDGDYGEVVRGLAKSMKDANIAVVTQAAQCIEVLAKGLRKPFSKYRSIVLGPILDRCKEKKASVADALGLALDQVFVATTLADNLEEILEYLKHKNPQVKEATMKFLVRCLKTTRVAPSKPEVTLIVEAAKKLLSESSEGLRSGGAEVLGTIMKIMGERAMNPHLEGLDDIRKTKIKEYYDVAEVKAKDKPKPPPQAAAPKAAPAAAPRKVIAKKPAAKKAAPKPSPYAQEAPLAPQPTAKSAPKLVKPGLKAPARALAAPAASPRRPAVAPAPLEPDSPPPVQSSRLGLGGRGGLAGRSLAKTPAANPSPPPSMSPDPSSGLSAIERAELEELRMDKDRLLRQADDFRQERSRLNSEIGELKNQNAQLIEDHTRDVLSIKAKETQLVRSRSDCEAAEAQCGQLKREMERLKRALSTSERVNTSAVTSPSRESSTDGTNSIYRDSGMYGASQHRNGYGSGRRISYNPNSLSEEKENSDEHEPYGRKKLSPELSRSGRESANSGRSSPAPHTYPSAAPSDRTSAPAARVDSNSGGQESWKRAAEVTSALKAKIEQMKARQGLSRP